MRTFKEDMDRAVAFHGHLCSGQCLGVRMAHLGMRLVGVNNDDPNDKKKLMVFVECNRCPADGIMMATGCTVGKRTYYFHDLGKAAATFLNVDTGKTVRVVRINHIHPPEGMDLIEFYATLPEDGWLEANEVTVTLQPGDMPGPTVGVVTCARCGEEVTDDRHVECEGQPFCRSCAIGTYYKMQLIKEG